MHPKCTKLKTLFTHLQNFTKKSANERTRTAFLLITSDDSRVAGVCTGLQTPHI
jgi:hypothetical protein